MTAQAAAELLRRRMARQHLLDFTLYTKPDYQANWHHHVLCQHLDRFVKREIKRLLVFMPPRHGKSELVSRRLPAYILGQNPEARLIACSYSSDLSSRLNRDVQRVMDDPTYHRLFPDTQLFGKNVRTLADGAYLRNSDVFEVVNHGGYYRSAGVGGGITGMGYDYGIIDDPIKNREEADSNTTRESIWEWYTSTFRTRAEKDAAILITMTRWHEDDLSGRLIEAMQGGPDAEQWHMVYFPALSEAGVVNADDPRLPGQALWPDKYNNKALAEIRMAIGSRQWLALYQQTPRAQEGNMFKRAWFPIVQAAPATALRVLYIDKAGTEGLGKRTALVLLAYVAGIWFIEEVITGQWSAANREAVILQTAQMYRARYGNFEIVIEQEPGSGGKESVENTIRNLAGFIVHADRPTGDKDTRLYPFQAQAEVGNVRMVAGPWNAQYLEEMTALPNSKFRDQSDATAGGFNWLAARSVPAAGAVGERETPHAPRPKSSWNRSA